MKFPYTIDTARRHARVTLSGTVHGSDIAEMYEVVYRDPQWQAGFDLLWDGTGITELLMEAADQPGFIELQHKYADVAGGGGRDVILVTRPLDYTMAKLYAIMAKGSPREAYVVKTEAEATKILDHPRTK